MTARILKISDQPQDADHIREAVKILDAGGLVAFPTETVYGIACRARRDSLEQLDRFKGRGIDKHYTLHIGHRDAYREYIPTVPLRVEKLAQQAWPGPLTLVFRLDSQDATTRQSQFDSDVFATLYKDNSIGIRCPDHPVASLLLRAASDPVVAPSANLAGQEPATNAGEVLSQFSDRIALVLDGGPCKYGRSSTVATVGPRGVEVLREGVYSLAQLRAMAQVIFLCVCTGNTCRSPMAEGLLRKQLAEKIGCSVDQLEEMGYKVISAGTMNMLGVPASTEAVVACGKRAVDITDHTSQPLTQSLIEASDFVFCMARSHCDQVISLSPQARERCCLLAGDREIPDPIGRPQEYFDNCANMIEAAVRARVREFIL